jgi:hypothetical protein
MIRNRHPFLTDVWCMDGLKVMLEQSGDALIQEWFYNAWTQDHYVLPVLCFCLDEMVPLAYINIPGTVYNSQVANHGNIYNKLQSVYKQDGAQCTFDSAFSNILQEFLIKLCRT